MNTRNGFIAAGCWTLDRIKQISAWPHQEQLCHIVSTEIQGGGSAHNFGIDIKKLDSEMPVEAIGLVGEDAEGDFLLEQARSLGINTHQLKKNSSTNTSFTDVMSVIDTGKRTFFHYSGSNDIISPEHFNFDQSNAKWLHLGLLGVHASLDRPLQQSGDVDENGWVRILKNAKKAGLKTNIEMVSISAEVNRKIGLPCLPYLDALIVNDHEIGGLAEIETIKNNQTQPDACLAAAKRILNRANDKGELSWVVVHFPDGAICVTANGEEMLSDSLNVKPETIKSTVGAGDAFAAGMLYAIHENWPVENALQLAHATAAASLRAASTVGAVQSVDEVLSLAGWKRPYLKPN